MNAFICSTYTHLLTPLLRSRKYITSLCYLPRPSARRMCSIFSTSRLTLRKKAFAGPAWESRYYIVPRGGSLPHQCFTTVAMLIRLSATCRGVAEENLFLRSMMKSTCCEWSRLGWKKKSGAEKSATFVIFTALFPESAETFTISEA